MAADESSTSSSNEDVDESKGTEIKITTTVANDERCTLYEFLHLNMTHSTVAYRQIL